jgi:DNA polymerase-3 subunit gamma/tau
MSYVVLARKYRPRSFAQMVGQDHVVQALTHALEQQRLHHAYLFTGTRGIGKTTVSRILAKSLNCTGPDGTGGITAQPCGVCAACTEIDADRYIDYMELDAASNRGIDEARDLIERATYKPTVGRFKVFMIDEAHQLTKDAFSALLKTLEEPPEYLKFVLATTDPDKMLPTVLSRCLQFNLRPMAPQTVHSYLQQVLEAESVAADAGALRLLSRAARGSMRDALSLTDQAIAYGAGRLEEAAVRAMLGSVDRAHVNRLVEALAARDGRAVVAEADALRSLGLSAVGALEEMARLLQQMAVEQVVPGTLDQADPDTAAVRALAPLLAADETQLLYSIALHGRNELQWAPDEHAGLVMVLLRFLAFPSVTPTAASAGMGPAAAPSMGTAIRPGGAAPQPTSAGAPRHAALVRDAGTQATATQVRPQVSPQALPQTPQHTPAPFQAHKPSAPRIGAVADDPFPASMAYDDDALQDTSLPLRPAGDAAQQTAPTAPRAVAVAAEPGESSTPVAAAAPADLLLEGPAAELGAAWADMAAALVAAGSVTALARQLALQSQLCACTPEGGGELWQLRVEHDSLRSPALVDKLQTALQAHLGRDVRLQVESGSVTDTPARREALRQARRLAEAEAVIRNDPVVQAVLAQFSTARIVPGSIKAQ